jgi:hypothetical protein
MRYCPLLALGALVALAGCNREPRTHPVTGSVTWNGQPVAEGIINFVADDMAVAPDSAKIVNGKYEARVKAGRKKVEIFGMRDKRFNEAMGQMERESYIPPRFNALSTLTRDVQAGENQFDFQLSDKD